MQTMIHDTTIVTADDACTVQYGALLTIDEAVIVQKADHIGRAAWQRLFAERPTFIPPAGFHPLACER